MKITISELKRKYLKLISKFEKETGKHAIWSNKITGRFIYWIQQKIKYKNGFVCVDPNCPKYKYEFQNKRALVAHNHWHNQEYRENQIKAIKETQKNTWDRPGYREKKSKITIKLWQDKKYRKSLTGKNSSGFKEDAGMVAKHMWIRIHFPQKEFCNNKCEICGKINLNLDLARFIHINVRNMENPMLDYFYACRYIYKNSCHQIYDKLNIQQKKILLDGAMIREDKLERIKEYVLKLFQ